MRLKSFSVPLCALCFASVGCRSTPQQTPQTLPTRFVETVPGSTVTFAMLPVERTDDVGKHRVLWFAETETTWDAYDVFYLRLDEQAAGADVSAAGREGPDAITRPTLPYKAADRGWGHAGYPAMGVSFLAATRYCEWLSASRGRHYRLPTVDEFRDALPEARSGSPPAPLEMAWLADNAGETTHPVRSKLPSRHGLYDVAGNVAEWCVGNDGKPVVCGRSFKDSLAEIGERVDSDGVAAESPSRAWQASDPSFPKSKWWLSDAPFVGFRVVCEERPK